MTVVYWQAFILGSITLAFWLGRWFRRTGRARSRWWMPVVVAFWVVWTVAKIWSSGLMTVQLAVVVGTVVVNVRFARQLDAREAASRWAKELEQRVEALRVELTEKEGELLARVPPESLRFIASEEEHRGALREQIDEAKTRLLITSGWITDRVVDRAFVGRLGSALDRGVSILLVFGYSSPREHRPLDSSGRNALRSLVDLSRERRPSRLGRLVVAYAPVHAKVLVRDRDVALVGSSNWLSNNNYMNEERTIQVRWPAFVDEVAENTARIAHGADAGAIDRLLLGEVG